MSFIANNTIFLLGTQCFTLNISFTGKSPFPDICMASTLHSFRSLLKCHLNDKHPPQRHFFNIKVSPHFQDFSVFSSFTNYSLTYEIPYIQFTSQLCSGLLSIFSYIPHTLKAGIFIYFVDELMHSQQSCAGACLDHILAANGHKSVLTSVFCKGTLIA